MPRLYMVWMQPWQITVAILLIAVAFTVGGGLLANFLPRVFTALFATAAVAVVLWGVYNFVTYGDEIDAARRRETQYAEMARHYPEQLRAQIKKIEETLPLLTNPSTIARWKEGLVKRKEALDDAESE